MRPLALSANSVARRIDVPVTRISEIVRGKRGITADTALRLARLFGTSSGLWLGLQAEYDLRMAQRDLSRAALSRIVPLNRAASDYGQRAARTPFEVAEQIEPYGKPNTGRRDRDRRRTRRSSS